MDETTVEDVVETVETKRELPTLTMRAAFRPETVDPEKRTVELTWTTGARVLRGFWERYYEELSLDAKHVRMGRLNNGAPLLDTHNMYGGVRGVLGVVEKAWLVGKNEGRALVRFAKAEDDPAADMVFRKLRDGIIQNVSVGYSTFRLEKVEDGADKIPVYRATDWEPFELSVVPVGADDGAGTRGRGSGETPGTPCVFVTRTTIPQDPTPSDEERTHMEPKKTETPAAPVTEPANQQKTDDAARAAAAEAATAAERARVVGIQAAVRAAKLPAELEKELIEKGTALDQARALVLEKLAAASEATRTEQHTRVEVGQDIGRESLRSGMALALQHRVAPGVVKLDDNAKRFAYRKLLQLAEDALEASGVKTRGLAPMEIAGMALGVGGGFRTANSPPATSRSSSPTPRARPSGAPTRRRPRPSRPSRGVPRCPTSRP